MQQRSTKAFAFPKAEHLCLRREIEALFSPGSHAATSYPVRAVFRSVPHDGKGPRVKVMLSVSKRHLRHAVDRNRAKRQLREAYRLNKCLLAELLLEKGFALHVGLIWLANEAASSERIQKSLVRLLHIISEHSRKSQSE